MNVEPDEGVEGGDGAAAPDQGGELVQDPLHLRAQDQEAARVLGEAESRVSWRSFAAKLFSYTAAGQLCVGVWKIYVSWKVF